MPPTKINTGSTKNSDVFSLIVTAIKGFAWNKLLLHFVVASRTEFYQVQRKKRAQQRSKGPYWKIWRKKSHSGPAT